MTTNQLRWAEIREGIRHNVATESETAYHNRNTEAAGFIQADASTVSAAAAMSNAGANWMNAGTRQQELGFSERKWDEGEKQYTIAKSNEAFEHGANYHADTLLKNQQASKVKKEVGEVEARTDLYREQTKTEKTKQGYNKAATAEKAASAVEKSVNAAGSAYDTGTKIFSDVVTGGATGITRNMGRVPSGWFTTREN